MPFYPTVDMCCDIVDWQEKMHYIDDALGMCAGLSSFPLKLPSLSQLPENLYRQRPASIWMKPH